MPDQDANGLISDYEPRDGFFDEAVDADGHPHPYAQALVESLERLGADGLAAAADRRDAIFVQQGITFEASGEDGPVKDRPFPLDLIPRIMPAAEWRIIKRGVAQRVRALNRFVEDVYHERGIVREGIVPWELVVTRPNFARAAHRHPPARRRLVPRVRLRPGARRRRLLEGAGGQRARPVGHLVRAGEPDRHEPAGAGPVRQVLGAAGQRLPVAAAGRAARRGPGRRRAAHRRGVDARVGQQRLLRARLPGPPDGRRAGRGLRPGGARHHGVHAHDARALAGGCHLPPHRRRLHRPAGVPAGLAAGRARPDARLPRRATWPSPTRWAPAWPTTRRSTTTCRR